MYIFNNKKQTGSFYVTALIRRLEKFVNNVVVGGGSWLVTSRGLFLSETSVYLKLHQPMNSSDLFLHVNTAL